MRDLRTMAWIAANRELCEAYMYLFKHAEDGLFGKYGQLIRYAFDRGTGVPCNGMLASILHSYGVDKAAHADNIEELLRRCGENKWT